MIKHKKNRSGYDIAHVMLDKELTLLTALLITNTVNGYFPLISKINIKIKRGLMNS